MTLTIVPAKRQAFLARLAARDPSLAEVVPVEVDLDGRPVRFGEVRLTKLGVASVGQELGLWGGRTRTWEIAHGGGARRTATSEHDLSG